MVYYKNIMRVSKLHSIIGSLLIFAFIFSPFGLIARAFSLENLNTTDLTKSDLFANDFAGGGYAMLDCFGTSSNILDSIQGFFGSDSSGQDKVAVDDKAQNLKEQCLDVAAQVNAQKTVASMSKSIFNWAETGNGGDPLYVKDFGKYLNSIDTQEIGVLKNKFTTEILNDPAKLPFAKEAVKTMQKADKSKDDIVGNLSYTGPDQKEFSKSFKSGGGWNSWLKMTQNPNNNPLGFNLKVGEEIQKKQTEAKENVKEELKQTSFLPVKTCVDPNYKSDGKPLTDEDRKLGKTDICSKWDVKTPGSIIKDQASEASNSALNLALNADQKGKQLNVMFASLLTQLFNQGFSTLGNRANQVMSNVQISSKVPTYGDNTGNDTSNNGDDWFDTAWVGGITPRDIPNIIKNQKEILNLLPERTTILQSLIDKSRELDYCVPGPNPLWAKSLGDFIAVKMEENGQKVEPDFGEKFLNMVVSNGSLTGGTGPVGLIIGLLMNAHAFNYYSREELNSIYLKNTITDTNHYFEFIQKTYNNPSSYQQANVGVFDNSDDTIKKLQQLFEIKTDSDRQYLNIPSYQSLISKNTLYISLTRKQMARMQDICVQTHKLYVQAFNRQSAQRRIWESWNRNPELEQIIGYRKNKLVNGVYVADSTSRLYTPEEARLSVTTYKSYTPNNETLQSDSDSNVNFDQILFNKLYVEVRQKISEPEKVPPLPPFSEYALNCTGNVGVFANPATITNTYSNNQQNTQ